MIRPHLLSHLFFTLSYKSSASRLLSVLLIYVGLLTGCNNKQSATTIPESPKAALTVELVSPELTQWPQIIEASGTITPWQEASIGTEINGLKLNQVLVNVGDAVHKGQLLAQFNDATIQADHMQQQAAVEEATANLMKAKSDMERAQTLDHTGALSQQDIMQYKTAFKTAQARLSTAKAQLTAQQLKWRYTKVIAPADGIISSRTATVGAVLSAGSELFKMIIHSRLEWRAEVPSTSITAIRLHQKAQIAPPGSTEFSINGTVRQIAPTLSTETRTGLVYVDVPAQSPLLKAGMFVSGRILLADQPALTVPESAIVLRDGYHYLMKVDASSHIHLVQVHTGRRYQNQVELINTSISSRDPYVLRGGSFLSEGDLVRITTSKSAIPSSVSAGVHP